MEQLIEFAGNHPLLIGAFVVVLLMVLKTELEHQTSRSWQLEPTAAIRLMNSDDTIVVDVRDRTDYDKGHIKNARNIPVASLKDKVDALGKDKSKPVLIYCRNGNVSGKACRLLKRAGYDNVHSIAGGMARWQDANLPITKK